MEKLSITELIEKVHDNAINKGFHKDIITIRNLFDYGSINKEQYIFLRDISLNSKLALINTEVAECTEALRKGDTENYREELADIAIRVFDLAGLTGVNLEEEILKKIAVNEQREYLHGKRF